MDSIRPGRATVARRHGLASDDHVNLPLQGGLAFVALDVESEVCVGACGTGKLANRARYGQVTAAGDKARTGRPDGDGDDILGAVPRVGVADVNLEVESSSAVGAIIDRNGMA